MIAILVFLLAAAGLWAQPSAPGGPGAPGAVGAPEEPEIVLPDVILRVDDLSVEQVQAALPGEEELLSPQRLFPLPGIEELPITEPELPGGVGEPGEEGAGAQGPSLAAQVVLGAGSMNHLYSLLSLNRVGGEPRFRLRFLHQMLDGIGGADPGGGAAQREDSLEAGLQARIGELGLDVEGHLTDREHGLQGEGGAAYASKVGRHGAVSVAVDHPLGEHLALGARLSGSFATELLTGPAPAAATEVLLEPGLWGEWHSGPARLTLQTRYVFQSLLESPAPDLQRVGAELLFSLGLKEHYLLEARAGWLWNSELGHLAPFSLTLSGNPAEFLSLQFSGGYRVQEVSFLPLLDPLPFVRLAEAALEDNHGWYGEAGVGLSFARSLSLQARGLVAANSALTVPRAVRDTDGVLWTIASEEGTQVGTDLALRWNLGSFLSVGFAVHSEWGERSDFTPRHEGSFELEAAPASGRWGARGAVGFDMGWLRDAVSVSETPTLDLSGYWNVTDAVSLVAELGDLLFPLGGEQRYFQNSWAPFEAPGLRGTVKVQINL